MRLVPSLCSSPHFTHHKLHARVRQCRCRLQYSMRMGVGMPR